MKVLSVAKIYISSEHIKILYSVLKLLSIRENRISRKDLIKESGVDKRALSRLIQNRYLLENLKDSQNGKAN